MSQGLKISEFPEITNSQLDNRDLFLVSEYVRNNVYASKKLSAKYLLNLKTEAVSLATSDKKDKEIYAGSIQGLNGQNILRFRTIKAGTDIELDSDNEKETILIKNKINAQNIAAQAENSATVFLKKEDSILKFKNIVGEKGILTRSDDNKVYVRPKEHHYLFVPCVPNNPSKNKTAVSIASKQKSDKDGLFRDRPLSGAWDTGSQTADLTSIINDLPSSVKESLNLAEKGLALVRIRLNTNSGGNVGHHLDVKSTDSSTWERKISIDPTGGGGAFWEGEDTCTSIIAFNKSNNKFNWKMGVASTSRNSSWEFSIRMVVEGFFV